MAESSVSKGFGMGCGCFLFILVLIGLALLIPTCGVVGLVGLGSAVKQQQLDAAKTNLPTEQSPPNSPMQTPDAITNSAPIPSAQPATQPATIPPATNADVNPQTIPPGDIPKQVTLKVDEVLQVGASGKVTFPVGTVVNVIGLSGDSLTVGVLDARAQIPVKDTSLLDDVKAARVNENSLGMRFVPAGTPGTLFSIWDTRVEDFEAFVKATNYDATAEMYSTDSTGNYGAHGDSWKNPGFAQGPTSPVVGVSWNDAKAFCQWLTDKEHKEGTLKPEQSYRLPTDAEWSKAVGLNESADGMPQSKDGFTESPGAIMGVYPWGTQWPPPPGAGNFADITAAQKYPNRKVIDGYNDGYANTSPVGSFKPNSYGLFDMSGNVDQLCEDWYNPSTPVKLRVARGGSWDVTVPGRLLSSARGCPASDDRLDATGFRCVLVVPSP